MSDYEASLRQVFPALYSAALRLGQGLPCVASDFGTGIVGRDLA